MPSVRPVLLALLFAAPAIAQEAAPIPVTVPEAEPVGPPLAPVPVPPLARGRITGSVLCADTRQPARGATVILQSVPTSKDESRIGRQFTTHVTSAGTYTIEHVAPGDYVVLGFYPGYLSAYDDLPDSAQTDTEPEMVRQLAAQGTTSVTAEGTTVANLVLARGAAISGRVLYSDGSPATQVKLSLEDTYKTTKTTNPAEDFGAVVRAVVLHQSSGTDDLGHFRISGIKPGKYRLAAVPPAAAETALHLGGFAFDMGIFTDPKAIRIYSGDTFHQNTAKKYDLHAGDEITGVDIRIPIDGFHSVRGLLNALDGRPVNMASLTLTDSTDEKMIFYTELATDGTFDFTSIPAGTYTLQAKDAKIGMLPGDLSAMNVEVPSGSLTPTNAFADGSTSILVKDSDLTGVILSLTEVALPKPAPLVP